MPDPGSSTETDGIPPAERVPLPRTGAEAMVDTECTYGEYYLTLSASPDGEPIELSAEDGERFADLMMRRSATVRRLNGR